MKKIIILITAFTLGLTSCTFEDVVEENVFVSSAFEIVVDFTPSNNYEFIEPYGFDVLPSDVTLVYMLWEDNPGDQNDVWRLVPQTVIFDDGNDLVYNFDFSQNDVRFFLEGSNLDGLDFVWTENQVFRVVVVPADNVGRLDYSDINTVMDTYNITEFTKR